MPKPHLSPEERRAYNAAKQRLWRQNHPGENARRVAASREKHRAWLQSIEDEEKDLEERRSRIAEMPRGPERDAALNALHQRVWRFRHPVENVLQQRAKPSYHGNWTIPKDGVVTDEELDRRSLVLLEQERRRVAELVAAGSRRR